MDGLEIRIRSSSRSHTRERKRREREQEIDRENGGECEKQKWTGELMTKIITFAHCFENNICKMSSITNLLLKNSV